MIVEQESLYNAILGRSLLNKIEAIVSMLYLAMKFCLPSMRIRKEAECYVDCLRIKDTKPMKPIVDTDKRLNLRAFEVNMAKLDP